MTNIQLLLSIGIPSLLIVLSWMNNNSRFERIERRLDDHDKEFKSVNGEFKSVISLFDDLKDANHRDALEIMRSMTALHERVAVVEAKQRDAA